MIPARIVRLEEQGHDIIATVVIDTTGKYYKEYMIDAQDYDSEEEYNDAVVEGQQQDQLRSMLLEEVHSLRLGKIYIKQEQC